MKIFRRFLSLSIPVGAVISGTLYCQKDLKTFADSFQSQNENTQQQTNIQSSRLNYAPMYFTENYGPSVKWNYNWDNCEPLSLVNHKKYEAANEEEKKEMLSKVKPTATRNIILIRHGQYHLNSEKKNLTELGKEQAAFLGKRFALSNLKIDKVVMSTMNRATETAQIMLNEMEKSIPSNSDSIIEEGAPYPPEPPHSTWKPRHREFFTEGSRIEAAFRKYFHRASPKQKEDSTEIIVCHGNVIRFFVCRALQFPPEGWLRMSIGHSSITRLVIRPNGLVSLQSYGDIGHLPADKISFS